jgi:ankyrin repeat protein
VNTAKILFNCIHDSCATDDEHRDTPLIIAAREHQGEVVRVLLERGANVESTNANGCTALHYAAWYGHLGICRQLLDWGAKVNSLAKWKNTPLHEAARWGHLSVVKLLVEKGANVRLKNHYGQTASDKARSNGQKAVADWLDSVSRGKVL